MKVAFVVAALAAGAITLAAQVRPPSPLRPPEPLGTATRADHEPAQSGGSITVEGCLRGSSLEPASDDLILTAYGAHEYDLQISRSLNERLLSHQGHTERVIGTLEVPTDPDRTAIAKAVGGKTQVVASTTTAGDVQHGTPLISVKSVVHVADRCGAAPKRDPSPARTGSTMPAPQ